MSASANVVTMPVIAPKKWVGTVAEGKNEHGPLTTAVSLRRRHESFQLFRLQMGAAAP